MTDLLSLQIPESEKIEKLLNKVIKRIPQKARTELFMNNQTAIFLADKTNSFCHPLYFYQHSQEISDPIRVNIIVLSPHLIEETSESIIYTIAHELSHAYLKHALQLNDIENAKQIEIDADKQVIKWGFEKELRACSDNYIYGNGLKNTFRE